MPRPASASADSRLATSTTLIPAAAICRENSLPIPDEAPVTSAQGPNCCLSRVVFIFAMSFPITCKAEQGCTECRGEQRSKARPGQTDSPKAVRGQRQTAEQSQKCADLFLCSYRYYLELAS